MFMAETNDEAWKILRDMLDTVFLQKLLEDSGVSDKLKQVALLLLLVIASDSIYLETSNEAKIILNELKVVLFHQELAPYAYTYKAREILLDMDKEATLSSKTHQCANCVGVPTLGDVNERRSCVKYKCMECRNFTYGQDTVHNDKGTSACSEMQQIMAWANMVRLLVPLAIDVAKSSAYRHASENFTQCLKVWRYSYYIWALPMLFTPKKNIMYLKDALRIFQDQTSCVDVLWRHVSLLLRMQQVLQMKVHTPLTGELLNENRKTLAEFQEKYGRFLPPLPSLSQ